MKIYKNLLMIAAMAIAFTACTQEGDVPVLPTDEQPISFSASVPVKAFGVESRANQLSFPDDLTLHFKMKGSDEWSTCVFEDLYEKGHTDLVTGDATNGWSFNALYAYTSKSPNWEFNPEQPESESNPKYKDVIEHRDLVWSLIQEDGNNKATFYLTATKDGVAYWAKAEVADGTPVTFGEMKPRKTRFILNLTVSGSKADKRGFTFSLSGVKKAADNAIVTEQAWPATTTTYVENDFSWDSTSEAANGKYTYSHDFAPQTVGNLTIKYGNTFTWTKSLSGIKVDFDGQESTADLWKPGYQITLNVEVALDDLTPGIITVNGFTDGVSQDFNGTVVQP